MGLILPFRPNKLIYPGTRPGFDPAHPAARNCVLAAVADSTVASNANFTNLVNGKKGTPSGTLSSPIFGPLGPTMLSNTNSTQVVTFPGSYDGKGALTMAAIVAIQSPGPVTTSYILNDASGGQNGIGAQIAAGLNNFHGLITAGIDTGLNINANSGPFSVPYFCAFSHINSSTSDTAVVVNLATGQSFVFPLTNSGQTISVGDGTLYVGNRGAARNWNGWIAAVSYSNTFLNTDQLLLWGANPWSLWYPPKLDLSFLLRTPSVAAPTGTLAATEAPDTAVFNGTAGVAGTWASTETPDVALFNGTVAVTGTLATTESPDTAAFNGNTVVSGTWVSTEAADTAALSGNTVASGSFAVTEAQDVASFAGSGIVSGTFAATDTPDIAVLSGNAGTSGSLSATTSQDAAAFAGNFGIAGSWVSTEASDLAVFVGQFGIASGTLAANDNADVAAFIGSATGAPSGSLAVTELPDNVVFLIDYMAPPQVSAASPYPSPFDYGWSYGEPPLRPGMPGSGTGRSS